MQNDTAVKQTVTEVDDQQTLRAYVRANYKAIAVVLVVGLLVAVVIYQVQLTNNLKSQTSKATSSSSAAKTEAITLRDQVASVLELPSAEIPTVATVQDPSKLQNQAFFARAEVGDKVLMFAKAQQVVLYRPSTKKVIQVAPINLGTGSSTAAASPATTTGQ
ncbi:MAG: hypothetical protein ABIV43_04095 [Candidatus Saccharimonadales bacterium]